MPMTLVTNPALWERPTRESTRALRDKAARRRLLLRLGCVRGDLTRAALSLYAYPIGRRNFVHRSVDLVLN